ncbi:Na+/H+ antiporter subunit A [Sporosarcina newyorkensis]|uniref:Multisubunit sodium/proton antiporter, MrpA subunit (TC 2.A.63.1) n=1 Tax=Sporosarcina newyorkensis TaxID=759851 RepID=A0A1T4YNB6_9BACL|nr:Na+/H+ antiporter subunit A [Sporosarcina newyorkensis]SKB03317.1 multisubunit sodium/proton antiporter, MrpA subunit (TC 2.A.63.1) [Sporosarcina newyorkensis]
MITVLLAIFIPFIAACLVPFVHKFLTGRKIGWFVIIVPLLLFVLLLRLVPSLSHGATYTYSLPWIPSADVYFSTYLDGLSMIFALLITGIGSLVVFYSIFYLSEREAIGRFYTYLLLFMGAMLGVVLSDNLIVLYVFWELTSISSFLLIAFWFHRKQSRYGAKKSMLITVTGGIFMLAGFLMLYTMTGTFSLRELIGMRDIIAADSLFIPAMLLVLLGAFTKSAQFPFHIWLPDAMEAPTPVSAYLHSATMVKAGIYLVARFTPVFAGHAVWFYIVSCVGLLTMLWGSVNAVKQTDLKALLAFSTVSQLGMIMSLLGVGSLAFASSESSHVALFTAATFAALFHLVNHSTFKGSLFMVVGILDHQLGTRNIRRLGGLATIMPITFTIALIGSFSMAGLPPFNGFLSKELFFEAMLSLKNANLLTMDSLALLFPIVAWVGSVFTFIYCMVIVFQSFLGKVPEPFPGQRPAHEAPIQMLVAPIVLGSLVLLIFFFPNILGTYILGPAMLAVYPHLGNMEGLVPEIYVWHGWKAPVFMTLGVIIAGTLLYRYLRYWKGVYRLGVLQWTLDRFYNGTLLRMERVATRVTRGYMTGSVRDYVAYIMLIFIAFIGIGLAGFQQFVFDFSNDASIEMNEGVIVFVMMCSSVAVLFARSRITAIILNGVLGYSIAILFVVFRAPDLALTQIIVETVTTVLFLLCFYFLPEWRAEHRAVSMRWRNGLIAAASGVIVTVVALLVQGHSLYPTISIYYETASRIAGGLNVVNTILGDFRAFDTMLEVLVLFIAGLGVFSLVKLRRKKGVDRPEEK